MMHDAHQGQFDVLVVWALDRFGRSTVGNIQAVLDLDRCGVQVVSVREEWLDTSGPVRSLLIAIFGWVAEQERVRLSERTKAGIERARRQGVHVGRPVVRVDVERPRTAWGLVARACARARQVRARARRGRVGPGGDLPQPEEVPGPDRAPVHQPGVATCDARAPVPSASFLSLRERPPTHRRVHRALRSRLRRLVRARTERSRRGETRHVEGSQREGGALRRAVGDRARRRGLRRRASRVSRAKSSRRRERRRPGSR